MSCKRFQHAVIGYACGAALDESARAHLASCARCRRVFDEERRFVARMDDDLHRALQISASADFSARVSAQLKGTEPDDARGRWWIGLAAAAALALVSYLVISDRPPEEGRIAPLATVAGSGPLVSVPGGPGTDGPPALPQASFDSRREQARRGDTSAKDAPPARPAHERQPEVLVPPTQLEAVTRLRELVLRGSLDDASLPLTPLVQVSPGDLVIAPLVIPDLVIPDLTSAADGPATAGE